MRIFCFAALRVYGTVGAVTEEMIKRYIEDQNDTPDGFKVWDETVDTHTLKRPHAFRRGSLINAQNLHYQLFGLPILGFARSHIKCLLSRIGGEVSEDFVW
jgi:hypothetical protein